MNTGFRQSLFGRLFFAPAVAVLLVVPIASQAQTNTAYGTDALFSNLTGYYDTAYGAYALTHNTTGYGDTATGYLALAFNTTGNYNTANGYGALYFNTTGSGNTAYGSDALRLNTTGSDNTANGGNALYSNTTGSYNTANGCDALVCNTTGSYNKADGAYALYSNTTGSDNTAIGYGALYSNTTGGGNIALGYQAGYAITSGSNNIEIGNTGASTDSGVIRIGVQGTHKTTFVGGIYGTPLSGYEVVVTSSGQLGVLGSSRRFKNDIKDMGDASARLMNLRPRTFRYKDAVEHGSHSLQYGLIAEEVAQVYPDLVQYDKQGKPFTVNYHLLTPMLLNEFQKEHHRNEAQKAEIAAQTTEITALKATLQTQSTELASLKQAQQQQLQVLAKLTAFVTTSQHNAPLQKAVFLQHP